MVERPIIRTIYELKAISDQGRTEFVGIGIPESDFLEVIGFSIEHLANIYRIINPKALGLA